MQRLPERLQPSLNERPMLEAQAKPSTSSHMAPGSFNYQSFYELELEKKHKDK
jgi:hypothetical protein